MKAPVKTCIFALALALALSTSAVATDDELKGRIESINESDRSFVVHGKRFYVSEYTDYDDGLKNFSDLAVGQRVEVDFEYRENRPIATEIERED